ncbi:hypothetical protein HmCmsJML014_02860 [Escherichia coli]|nr:hypothetical protein HmCmsJML014_02860 [Escherichia coli]
MTQPAGPAGRLAPGICLPLIAKEPPEPAAPQRALASGGHGNSGSLRALSLKG